MPAKKESKNSDSFLFLRIAVFCRILHNKEMIRIFFLEREADMNTLLDLFLTFVRIGCVTFGGGYAMLPILERELVDKRGWTTLDDLRDYFSIGQCTAGVIALNVSTFIGEKRGGIRGAIAATVGFLTGPVTIILIIAMFLRNFAQLELVQHQVLEHFH